MRLSATSSSLLMGVIFVLFALYGVKAQNGNCLPTIDYRYNTNLLTDGNFTVANVTQATPYPSGWRNWKTTKGFQLGPGPYYSTKWAAGTIVAQLSLNNVPSDITQAFTVDSLVVSFALLELRWTQECPFGTPITECGINAQVNSRIIYGQNPSTTVPLKRNPVVQLWVPIGSASLRFRSLAEGIPQVVNQPAIYPVITLTSVVLRYIKDIEQPEISVEEYVANGNFQTPTIPVSDTSVSLPACISWIGPCKLVKIASVASDWTNPLQGVELSQASDSTRQIKQSILIGVSDQRIYLNFSVALQDKVCTNRKAMLQVYWNDAFQGTVLIQAKGVIAVSLDVKSSRNGQNEVKLRLRQGSWTCPVVVSQVSLKMFTFLPVVSFVSPKNMIRNGKQLMSGLTADNPVVTQTALEGWEATGSFSVYFGPSFNPCWRIASYPVVLRDKTISGTIGQRMTLKPNFSYCFHFIVSNRKTDTIVPSCTLTVKMNERVIWKYEPKDFNLHRIIQVSTAWQVNNFLKFESACPQAGGVGFWSVSYRELSTGTKKELVGLNLLKNGLFVVPDLKDVTENDFPNSQTAPWDSTAGSSKMYKAQHRNTLWPGVRFNAMQTFFWPESRIIKQNLIQEKSKYWCQIAYASRQAFLRSEWGSFTVKLNEINAFNAVPEEGLIFKDGAAIELTDIFRTFTIKGEKSGEDGQGLSFSDAACYKVYVPPEAETIDESIISNGDFKMPSIPDSAVCVEYSSIFSWSIATGTSVSICNGPKLSSEWPELSKVLKFGPVFASQEISQLITFPKSSFYLLSISYQAQATFECTRLRILWKSVVIGEYQPRDSFQHTRDVLIGVNAGNEQLRIIVHGGAMAVGSITIKEIILVIGPTPVQPPSPQVPEGGLIDYILNGAFAKPNIKPSLSRKVQKAQIDSWTIPQGKQLTLWAASAVWSQFAQNNQAIELLGQNPSIEQAAILFAGYHALRFSVAPRFCTQIPTTLIVSFNNANESVVIGKVGISRVALKFFANAGANRIAFSSPTQDCGPVLTEVVLKRIDSSPRVDRIGSNILTNGDFSVPATSTSVQVTCPASGWNCTNRMTIASSGQVNRLWTAHQVCILKNGQFISTSVKLLKTMYVLKVSFANNQNLAITSSIQIRWNDLLLDELIPQDKTVITKYLLVGGILGNNTLKLSGKGPSESQGLSVSRLGIWEQYSRPNFITGSDNLVSNGLFDERSLAVNSLEVPSYGAWRTLSTEVIQIVKLSAFNPNWSNLLQGVRLSGSKATQISQVIKTDTKNVYLFGFSFSFLTSNTDRSLSVFYCGSQLASYSDITDTNVKYRYLTLKGCGSSTMIKFSFRTTTDNQEAGVLLTSVTLFNIEKPPRYGVLATNVIINGDFGIPSLKPEQLGSVVAESVLKWDYSSSADQMLALTRGTVFNGYLGHNTMIVTPKWQDNNIMAQEVSVEAGLYSFYYTAANMAAFPSKDSELSFLVNSELVQRVTIMDEFPRLCETIFMIQGSSVIIGFSSGSLGSLSISNINLRQVVKSTINPTTNFLVNGDFSKPNLKPGINQQTGIPMGWVTDKSAIIALAITRNPNWGSDIQACILSKTSATKISQPFMPRADKSSLMVRFSVALATSFLQSETLSKIKVSVDQRQLDLIELKDLSPIDVSLTFQVSVSSPSIVFELDSSSTTDLMISGVFVFPVRTHLPTTISTNAIQNNNFALPKVNDNVQCSQFPNIPEWVSPSQSQFELCKGQSLIPTWTTFEQVYVFGSSISQMLYLSAAGKYLISATVGVKPTGTEGLFQLSIGPKIMVSEKVTKGKISFIQKVVDIAAIDSTLTLSGQSGMIVNSLAVQRIVEVHANSQIQNGDFSLPALPEGQKTMLSNSVPGWTGTEGNVLISRPAFFIAYWSGPEQAATLNAQKRFLKSVNIEMNLNIDPSASYLLQLVYASSQKKASLEEKKILEIKNNDVVVGAAFAKDSVTSTYGLVVVLKAENILSFWYTSDFTTEIYISSVSLSPLLPQVSFVSSAFLTNQIVNSNFNMPRLDSGSKTITRLPGWSINGPITLVVANFFNPLWVQSTQAIKFSEIDQNVICQRIDLELTKYLLSYQYSSDRDSRLTITSPAQLVSTWNANEIWRSAPKDDVVHTIYLIMAVTDLRNEVCFSVEGVNRSPILLSRISLKDPYVPPKAELSVENALINSNFNAPRIPSNVNSLLLNDGSMPGWVNSDNKIQLINPILVNPLFATGLQAVILTTVNSRIYQTSNFGWGVILAQITVARVSFSSQKLSELEVRTNGEVNRVFKILDSFPQTLMITVFYPRDQDLMNSLDLRITPNSGPLIVSEVKLKTLYNRPKQSLVGENFVINGNFNTPTIPAERQCEVFAAVDSWQLTKPLKLCKGTAVDPKFVPEIQVAVLLATQGSDISQSINLPRADCFALILIFARDPEAGQTAMIDILYQGVYVTRLTSEDNSIHEQVLKIYSGPKLKSSDLVFRCIKGGMALWGIKIMTFGPLTLTKLTSLNSGFFNREQIINGDFSLPTVKQITKVAVVPGWNEAAILGPAINFNFYWNGPRNAILLSNAKNVPTISQTFTTPSSQLLENCLRFMYATENPFIATTFASVEVTLNGKQLGVASLTDKLTAEFSADVVLSSTKTNRLVFKIPEKFTNFGVVLSGISVRRRFLNVEGTTVNEEQVIQNPNFMEPKVFESTILTSIPKWDITQRVELAKGLIYNDLWGFNAQVVNLFIAAPAKIAQTVDVKPGNYILSYSAASSDLQPKANTSITVKYDGKVIDQFQPTSSEIQRAFFRLSVKTSKATLSFESTQTSNSPLSFTHVAMHAVFSVDGFAILAGDNRILNGQFNNPALNFGQNELELSSVSIWRVSPEKIVLLRPNYLNPFWPSKKQAVLTTFRTEIIVFIQTVTMPPGVYMLTFSFSTKEQVDQNFPKARIRCGSNSKTVTGNSWMVMASSLNCVSDGNSMDIEIAGISSLSSNGLVVTDFSLRPYHQPLLKNTQANIILSPKFQGLKVVVPADQQCAQINPKSFDSWTTNGNQVTFCNGPLVSPLFRPGSLVVQLVSNNINQVVFLRPNALYVFWVSFMCVSESCEFSVKMNSQSATFMSLSREKSIAYFTLTESLEKTLEISAGANGVYIEEVFLARSKPIGPINLVKNPNFEKPNIEGVPSMVAPVVPNWNSPQRIVTINKYQPNWYKPLQGIELNQVQGENYFVSQNVSGFGANQQYQLCFLYLSVQRLSDQLPILNIYLAAQLVGSIRVERKYFTPSCSYIRPKKTGEQIIKVELLSSLTAKVFVTNFEIQIIDEMYSEKLGASPNNLLNNGNFLIPILPEARFLINPTMPGWNANGSFQLTTGKRFDSKLPDFIKNYKLQMVVLNLGIPASIEQTFNSPRSAKRFLLSMMTSQKPNSGVGLCGILITFNGVDIWTFISKSADINKVNFIFGSTTKQNTMKLSATGPASCSIAIAQVYIYEVYERDSSLVLGANIVANGDFSIPLIPCCNNDYPVSATLWSGGYLKLYVGLSEQPQWFGRQQVAQSVYGSGSITIEQRLTDSGPGDYLLEFSWSLRNSAWPELPLPSFSVKLNNGALFDQQFIPQTTDVYRSFFLVKVTGKLEQIKVQGNAAGWNYFGVAFTDFFLAKVAPTTPKS